jgi:GntR family transcriptional regulator
LLNFPEIDRRSALPLYYQIQQHLLERIRSGALRPGEPVPSEQEIAARLRISRMTARQALKSLCELGVAYSQRGKGTFVSELKLEKNFRQVLSFSEEMQARGSRPRSRVLSFGVEEASPDVIAALRLPLNGEKVVSLQRVRLEGSAPMAIEWSRLPLRLCGELLEHFDPRGSLYRALQERYGIQITVTEEVVEACVAEAKDAKLLGIREGTPVFAFTRTSYVRGGQPVEYVKSIYRGDRYKLVNRLTRGDSGGGIGS